MGVNISGQPALLRELERILGKEGLKLLTDDALKAGAKVFNRELDIAARNVSRYWRNNRGGYERSSGDDGRRSRPPCPLERTFRSISDSCILTSGEQ